MIERASEVREIYGAFCAFPGVRQVHHPEPIGTESESARAATASPVAPYWAAKETRPEPRKFPTKESFFLTWIGNNMTVAGVC
jgi:hypothetical protein